ncbi:uncharacterized protein LOC120273953 [Dioscorea cayenensis subsp. rotundata]|uniref:Uncharacterized protein LOC120273953 n=1 Tax=Dioscorea cayennensis subsp. rotundata TaxID=55577 RepID=A0AB40CAM6_DIOCR|nr:uncharacterized protein LOC120273953 [Dioscorea cayenensis subsp. rotundata]
MSGDVRLTFDLDGRPVYVQVSILLPHEVDVVAEEEEEFPWPCDVEEEDEGLLSAFFDTMFGDMELPSEIKRLMLAASGEKTDLVVPSPLFGLGVVELGSCPSVIGKLGVVEPCSRPSDLGVHGAVELCSRSSDVDERQAAAFLVIRPVLGIKEGIQAWAL